MAEPYTLTYLSGHKSFPSDAPAGQPRIIDVSDLERRFATVQPQPSLASAVITVLYHHDPAKLDVFSSLDSEQVFYYTWRKTAETSLFIARKDNRVTVGCYDPSVLRSAVEWDPMIRLAIKGDGEWIPGYGTYSARGKVAEIWATPANDPYRMGYQQPASLSALEDIESQLTKFLLTNEIWKSGEGEQDGKVDCKVVHEETPPVLYA